MRALGELVISVTAGMPASSSLCRGVTPCHESLWLEGSMAAVTGQVEYLLRSMGTSMPLRKFSKPSFSA